ncbi:MAG: hypothetical protein UT19_C0008G0029 [Candidatus Woesebacteria bacterium GW2011_GWB1_39_10b]|uniref:Uncharacterized protein n=1 Tax=Candidatus Woesebacteria bacterium GW2011_GWB1_39_10b TaxID=1618573 RepID=A0A0G0P6G9_9BACT|nr:MAG: hypothetical protein UT19_C0008G0029 [Candidatus Woesebacteria bacterium GW2011_GWB1_39_10b]
MCLLSLLIFLFIFSSVPSNQVTAQGEVCRSLGGSCTRVDECRGDNFGRQDCGGIGGICCIPFCDSGEYCQEVPGGRVPCEQQGGAPGACSIVGGGRGNCCLPLPEGTCIGNGGQQGVCIGPEFCPEDYYQDGINPPDPVCSFGQRCCVPDTEPGQDCVGENTGRPGTCEFGLACPGEDTMQDGWCDPLHVLRCCVNTIPGETCEPEGHCTPLRCGFGDPYTTPDCNAFPLHCCPDAPRSAPIIRIRIFCQDNNPNLPPTSDPDSGRLLTAIGCIPIGSPQEFTSFLLTWGMGIAGGIAFVLMIYAGFLIITSAGNPQKLQAGKELLTAAIMGLILLLFGAYILQLIGVTILNIPGFRR